MTDIAIADLYSQLENFVGKQVSISGQILAADEAFIAASREAFLRGEYLRIRDGGIVRKLMMTIPPRGGGPFLHNEIGRVTGIIEGGENGYELTNLSACTVNFRGKDYTIV